MLKLDTPLKVAMKKHHVYKIPLNVKSIEIQHLCFFKSTQSVQKIFFFIQLKGENSLNFSFIIVCFFYKPLTILNEKSKESI